MVRTFTIEDARRIGAEIGIDWGASPFHPAQFWAGMAVELEHGSHDPQTDVTGDDLHLTAKIAWAHLKEFPDYYVRLARMEAEAELAAARSPHLVGDDEEWFRPLKKPPVAGVAVSGYSRSSSPVSRSPAGSVIN